MIFRHSATLATLCFLALPCHAGTVGVNVQASVRSNEVRLSDIFSGVDASKDRVVARAPEAGKSMTIEAPVLASIARANGLSWMPATAWERVVVERASQTVEGEQVASAIKSALKEKGIDGDIDVRLDNRALHVVLPAETKTDIDVQNLGQTPATGRFLATVVLASGTPDEKRLSVGGQAFRLVDVPVPSHALKAGDSITAEDITWVKMNEREAGTDALTDITSITGRSTRRPLPAGRPLFARDIQAPVVIQKGSLVRMMVQTPALSLSVQGRALEDAAIGQAVKITNTDSNRIILATATGPGIATVSTVSAF